MNGEIAIEKAETALQRTAFLQVLESANRRMEKKGIVQWLPCHLTAEAVFEENVEPFLLEKDGQPAATALLAVEDTVFWPEKEKNSAVYVHRLSVAEGFAGWTAGETGRSCGSCMKGLDFVLWTRWKWMCRGYICAMPGTNTGCKKGGRSWEKSMCWTAMWQN